LGSAHVAMRSAANSGVGNEDVRKRPLFLIDALIGCEAERHLFLEQLSVK